MTQTPFMHGPNFAALNRLVANDDHELHEQIRATLRLLRPYRVKGRRKARFGSPNDGGYILLDDFEGVDTALSFGIEQNIDWDLEMAEHGLTIHQFDHTVEAPAPDDRRMIFSKTMIAPTPAPGAATLEGLVELLDKGHSRPNLILKMDIEAAE